MTAAINIRPATPHDAASLLAIYAPIVEHTATSFEKTPPTEAEFAERIAKSLSRWQWLIAERDGTCLGYAYGTSHRERYAYRWSVEVSAYLAPSAQRQGLGRRLYETLLADLAAKGFCNAYAGITLPNPASVALHERVGFAPIGVFPRVGYKFGAWHDVAWLHKGLRDVPPDSEP